MVPVLNNGDLITYRGILDRNQVKNGTILLYFAGETGLPSLDYVTKPIIIHRVVGQVIQPDGVVYYRTRGDNNQFNDPALVRADRVLGTPETVVPLLGGFLLFVKSPQGLVLGIAVFLFFYLDGYDRVFVRVEKKRKLLAVYARMALKGDLSLGQFEKFRLAVEFADDFPPGSIENSTLASLLGWLKDGELGELTKLVRQKTQETKCPSCLEPAILLKRGTGKFFVLCPRCSLEKEQPVLTYQEPGSKGVAPLDHGQSSAMWSRLWRWFHNARNESTRSS